MEFPSDAFDFFLQLGVGFRGVLFSPENVAQDDSDPGIKKGLIMKTGKKSSVVSILLAAFFFFYALPVKSLEKKRPRENKIIFNPVVSVSARTLDQWKVAFQKAAGANVNTNFLANSLSFAVLPRLEVGTVPVFYISAEHHLNYNLKVNFWRGESVDWAFAYAETRFRTKIETTTGTETPDLIMKASELILNLHPEGAPVSASVFASSICGYVDSRDSLVFIYSISCKNELGVDVQIPLEERQWITLGSGSLRDAGFSPYEKTHQGVGAAWTIYRPEKLFSRPSLGAYYTPERGSVLYLVSTTFYEQ